MYFGTAVLLEPQAKLSAFHISEAFLYLHTLSVNCHDLFAVITALSVFAELMATISHGRFMLLILDAEYRLARHQHHRGDTSSE